MKMLKKVLLKLFSRLNPGNINIRHHMVPDKKILLHSFKHKNYWYHGKNRERNSMMLFRKLLKQGDTVVEVGGHIGYLSLYFLELVSGKGQVHVFEPGSNNLPYIRKNLENIPNVNIVEKAASDHNGEARFYIENITGQNNSLIRDYEVFLKNKELSFSNEVSREVVINTIRLDDFLDEENVSPDFIKIDVEGAELDVINGMLSCLSNDKPMLMIEITRKHKEIYDTLNKNGYVMFNSELETINDYREIDFNTFCLHSSDHSPHLNELGISY